MNNYPFDTVSLSSDVINNYFDIYNALKVKFNIQFTGDIDFQLGQFEVFKGYADINIKGSYAFKCNNNNCYILFTEAHSRVHTRYGITDVYQYQTWALAFLKCDFGRVLIRRETLADKIIELVHSIELDFEEDKPFSDTFYVLVNDREKAARAINRNFRNAVMDTRHDNFTTEIFEHTLIIGQHETLSPERAVYLAEFMERLASTC
ncbi:MAG: hypothetical protein JWP44_3087 [Mucilaginibacter sp.]|nr:hypothetical protein [Mucilaginibacter sp.]